MKIKNLLYKSILGLSVALSVTSCKLDEYNPISLSEQDVLSKYDGWKAYQSNCYTGLWGTLIGMPYGICSEVGTDLWTNPANNLLNYRQVINYQDLTTDFNLVNNIWNYAWGSIKDCNKTIQLAPDLKDGKASDINTLVGEAKLLRAFYYSTLVVQFGELPLVLTDDPIKNLNPTRNSVADIYAQIIADLRDAFNNLGVAPFDNNPQRVSKKAALGLLARVYAQGAGEDLKENGKSYWVRAKECADSLINGMGAYGAGMYDDFAKVFASANNRNNQEVLFTAYGLDPYSPSYDVTTANSKPNLYLHYYPKFDDAFDFREGYFKRSVNQNTNNAYYGRLNQAFVAPTKYLINCFNANYDKRWENTFQTAFANYSGVRAIASGGAPAPANVKYADAVVTLTKAYCDKYGIDPVHIGKKIYPYVDVDAKNASKGATWQYIPQVWNKGATTGVPAGNLTTVANANVHPYPLTKDEDRFFFYLSKDKLTDVDKAERAYVAINIDDLFDPADPTGSTYKSVTAGNGFVFPALATQYPAMQKFNHNFDGGWLGGDFQRKLGNIMIMRMAEVYLIAAEATIHTTGDGAAAANYLNVLRKRACRNAADFNMSTGMQLANATMNDVFDEYARELCGEFTRWALLKRNKAFESRLQLYNKKAFANFNPAKHYKRPIPFSFLNQINNANEFGNNGY